MCSSRARWSARVVAFLAAQQGLSARALADEEERRRFLDAALDARSQNDHARALEQAKRALNLRETSSIQRFLAEEHDARGDLPNALASAQRCVEVALREPASANHDAVLLGCRGLVQSLRARIVLVRIELREPAPAGLTYLVDGAPPVALSPGLLAVRPGARLEVSAPSHTPLSARIEGEGGSEVPLPVVLARRTEEPMAMAPPRQVAPPRQSGIGWFPVALAGTGLLVAASGGALRLVSNGKYEDLASQCRTACPGDAHGQREAIENLDRLALGCALVGGAMMVAGGLVYVLGRPSSRSVVLHGGPTGIGVRGGF